MESRSVLELVLTVAILATVVVNGDLLLGLIAVFLLRILSTLVAIRESLADANVRPPAR